MKRAVTNILTDEEIAAMNATTPRPRRDDDISDAEVALTVERAWMSKFGKIQVAAYDPIQRIRRGRGGAR